MAGSCRRRRCRMGAHSGTVPGASLRQSSRLMRATKLLLACGWIMLALQAQSKPDLTGIWGPYRGGRGGDPKLAAPPAGPIVLKPEYAKAYQARQAAEAA